MQIKKKALALTVNSLNKDLVVSESGTKTFHPDLINQLKALKAAGVSIVFLLPSPNDDPEAVERYRCHLAEWVGDCRVPQFSNREALTLELIQTMKEYCCDLQNSYFYDRDAVNVGILNSYNVGVKSFFIEEEGTLSACLGVLMVELAVSEYDVSYDAPSVLASSLFSESQPAPSVPPLAVFSSGRSYPAPVFPPLSQNLIATTQPLQLQNVSISTFATPSAPPLPISHGDLYPAPVFPPLSQNLIPTSQPVQSQNVYGSTLATPSAPPLPISHGDLYPAPVFSESSQSFVSPTSHLFYSVPDFNTACNKKKAEQAVKRLQSDIKEAFNEAGQFSIGGFSVFTMTPKHVKELCECRGLSEMRDKAREALGVKSEDRQDNVKKLYAIIANSPYDTVDDLRDLLIRESLLPGDLQNNPTHEAPSFGN